MDYGFAFADYEADQSGAGGTGFRQTEMTITIRSCFYNEVARFRTAPSRGWADVRERASLTYWFIAELEDEPVGCCSLIHMSRKRARLSALYVLPKYRGQGLGRRMVLYRVEIARQRGYEVVDARTDKAGLYQGCGFRVARVFKKSKAWAFERRL